VEREIFLCITLGKVFFTVEREKYAFEIFIKMPKPFSFKNLTVDN